MGCCFVRKRGNKHETRAQNGESLHTFWPHRFQASNKMFDFEQFSHFCCSQQFFSFGACCAYFFLADATVEKVWLTEKVYAQLQQFYRERDFQLEIIDPHWAGQALISDDHSDVPLCLHLIELCQQSSTLGIFVVSLG